MTLPTVASHRHGVVVGKFYPPHLGHADLIERAAAVCDRVTVVVAASAVETIPLGDRVRWLAWHHAVTPHVTVVGAVDDHPVDYDDPAIWDLHMDVFISAIAEVAPGVPVDAVITGEDYGDELARRLQAESIRVDRSVTGHSGTAARADLAGRWATLIPAARMGLARRIVVVGAESTGTTTLATDLARHLDVPVVAEYGRSWSAAKLAAARQEAAASGLPAPSFEGLTWTSDEFTQIASVQQAAMDRVAEAHALVVSDTDPLATSVWHDRYVGGSHQAALDIARTHPAHLYLLTSPDGVAFEDDGLRDGEHLRVDMTEMFSTSLDRQPAPWALLEGSRPERLGRALAQVALHARLPHLADPLG